ncbi:MAG: pentapeptide repeat-containing protein [Saprospiraceae bacterium]
MQTFENQQFEHEKLLVKAKYDYCTFVNCQFVNSDLSKIIFIECTFENCDLSNANIDLTAFKTVTFNGCKLMGLRFDTCQKILLAFEFLDCIMDYVSFYELKLPNTTFKNCQLHEVDFTKANFLKTNFENCDLKLSIFDNTNLEKADFRTAYNFEIHPTLNRIKKAKFSKTNVIGLLQHFDIKIE